MIEEILKQVNEQAANTAPLGSKFKLVLDEHILMIDGTGETNVVTQEDGEADCTMTTSVETLRAMKSGDVNPMMAVMSGKVKIAGDMGLAMKLQSLLG